MPISKAHLMTAAVALAAFATVALIQRKFMAVPVVGDYLPK
jgi:hypothetical protein